ncbi:MAG: hypothetical protein KDK11_03090 [Maritimibacter sp.]|nr:hypothetical protein [Maritimibacter sp.]
MTDISLRAENDNPGGATETRLALIGLAQLLAKAEARGLARGLFAGTVSHDAPANRNHAPRKGDTK